MPGDAGRIFRGQWSQASERPLAADLRAQHLDDPPAGCRCLWCQETTDDPPPSLFDEET